MCLGRIKVQSGIYKDCSGRVRLPMRFNGDGRAAQTQAYQDKKSRQTEEGEKEKKREGEKKKEKRGIRLKSNDLKLVLRLEIS